MSVPKYKAEAPYQANQDILDYIEDMVTAELRKGSHVWTSAGIRVVYWVTDARGNRTGEEQRIERGELRPLDEAECVNVSDAEWQMLSTEESDEDPLTVAFADGVYEKVKAKLEARLGGKLVVGVAGVLSGSVSCWGAGCWCYPQRGAYRRCRLLCRLSRC